MSASSPSPTPALDADVQRLETAVRNQVDNGTRYIRARDLSDDVPESTKWVGQKLPKLAAKSTHLDFERWGGGSDSILWYVKPADNTQ